jgi:uncharacterized protein YunC (DUF1805 family)
MTKQQKATRVQIYLGDIPLMVYRLPSGKYKLSGRNVTDAVDEDANTLLRKMGVKSLKALPHAESESYKINPGKEGSPFVPVVIEDAVTYWGTVAEAGNKKAMAILMSCAIESIERRADHALGIQLSEELRNARMKARIDGILQRNFWTDCIKVYVDNNDVSDNYKRWVYTNVSDYLNRQFFGMSAKQIRENYDIAENEPLRDHVLPEYLPDITFVEKYAGKLVERGVEPMTAMREAVEFSNIPVRPFSDNN